MHGLKLKIIFWYILESILGDLKHEKKGENKNPSPNDIDNLTSITIFSKLVDQFFKTICNFSNIVQKFFKTNAI